MHKKMKKKGSVLTILILVLYLIGAFAFMWRDLEKLENKIENQKTISAFQKMTAKIKEDSESELKQEQVQGLEQQGQKQEQGAEKRFVSEELYAQMQAYNFKIHEEGQKNLIDPWSYEEMSVDLKEYGIQDEIAAVLSIPRISLELPVYLGATSKNMAQGAAHLSQTSLPIGGINTNCVIAAHRGYKGIPMFRNIEDIDIGDSIILTNLWEELTYQVTEIEVVYPSEIEKILIRPDKDMVTLLTCHPYRQNIRRYVVYCERVESSEASHEAGMQGKEVHEEKGDEGEVHKEEAHEEEVYEEEVRHEVKVRTSREEAMEEDGELLMIEDLLRKGGYILLLIVGVGIVVSLRKKR